MVVRSKHKASFGVYGFKVEQTDMPWRKLVGVLQSGTTHEDLNHASLFLAD